MTGKAIGIDLGGTFIKAGAVDASGRILSRVKLPTGVPEGRAAVIARVAQASDEARRKAGLAWRRLRGIGLGAPIVIGPDGIVHHAFNLKCLQKRKLAEPVRQAIGGKGLRVMLDNDANVAALAESWLGAGRSADSLVLFTLGTGIGGGIVLDGRIWRGAWGAGAEIGHQTLFPDGVVCQCGNVGCLEAYASAPALVRRLKEAVAAGRRTRLARAVKAGDDVSARDVATAAKAGDRLCRSLMEETGRFLGIAVTNMLHILNVEIVVFTGGMTAAGSLLLKPIRDEVRHRAFATVRRGLKIVFSRMGNDAGLRGAAALALERAPARRRRRSRAS